MSSHDGFRRLERDMAYSTTETMKADAELVTATGGRSSRKPKLDNARVMLIFFNVVLCRKLLMAGFVPLLERSVIIPHAESACHGGSRQHNPSHPEEACGSHDKLFALFGCGC